MEAKNKTRVHKFGESVLLLRGGHISPAPGQYRFVRATYIGASGNQVFCRLEEDDPDACVGYCTKAGDKGYWSRSCMFPVGTLDTV